MSCNKKNKDIEIFWSLSLAELHRQLAEAKRFCKDQAISNTSNYTNLSWADLAKQAKAPENYPNVNNFSEDSKNQAAINAENSDFQDVLAMLQREIDTLLKKANLLHNREYPLGDEASIKKIIEYTSGELESHYGSTSAGWDKLVGLKMALLKPHSEGRTNIEWLISLIATVEKSVRAITCMTISRLGYTPFIAKASSKLRYEYEIDIDKLLHKFMEGKSADVFAEELSQYMGKSANKTRRVASSFISCLNEKSEIENTVFTIGYSKVLSGYGTDHNEILKHLIKLRDLALHDIAVSQLGHSFGSQVNDLANWSSERCELVAQFLFSLSIRYTISLMSSVLTKSCENDIEANSLAEKLRYKCITELRVQNLELLEKDMYWLAWTLSDSVHEKFEDESKLMLQMNSAYARKKLQENDKDLAVFYDECVPEINDETAVRYKIYRKCLLEEFDSEMSDLIKVAIETRNISAVEFENWPAFRELRRNKEMKAVISKLTKARN